MASKVEFLIFGKLRYGNVNYIVLSICSHDYKIWVIVRYVCNSMSTLLANFCETPLADMSFLYVKYCPLKHGNVIYNTKQNSTIGTAGFNFSTRLMEQYLWNSTFMTSIRFIGQ